MFPKRNKAAGRYRKDHRQHRSSSQSAQMLPKSYPLGRLYLKKGLVSNSRKRLSREQTKSIGTLIFMGVGGLSSLTTKAERYGEPPETMTCHLENTEELCT